MDVGCVYYLDDDDDDDRISIWALSNMDGVRRYAVNHLHKYLPIIYCMNNFFPYPKNNKAKDSHSPMNHQQLAYSV